MNEGEVLTTHGTLQPPTAQTEDERVLIIHLAGSLPKKRETLLAQALSGKNIRCHTIKV
jgi:hypothetical protein